VAPRTIARLALVLLVASIARCAPVAPAPDVGTRAAAVYWGEDENGYDGVVRLTIAFSLLEGAMCSGTLVSSRVVVTAQHCVVDQDGAQVEPSAILVETGPAGTRAQYAVEEIRVPDGQSLSGSDFAVVITADEVAEVPYPYATAWEGRPGDPITLVGYGAREDGSSGRKARGDNEVGYVFDTYFTTTGEPGCHGDSGGPAFDADGVLVGVIVNTLGGWVGEDTCLSGVSGLTRVDSFHDIIDGAIEDSWVCDGAPQETCDDGRDNDCNRLVDDGCLALGEACSALAAFACASGDCRDFGDDSRCTQVCAVGVPGECPEEFYCDEVGCGEAACVAGVRGPSILGDACTLDTDCENLACVETGDGARCLRPCSADSACTAGETCVDPDEDGCGGCAPTGDGAPFDAPCAAGSDCASGLCVVDAFGALCSTPCADGCPDGFACDPEDHCVRVAPAADPGGLGEACAESTDCATGLCGRFEDFRACTAECGAEAPCPGDLVCQAGDADADASYCRPRTPPPPRADPGDEEGGCGCRKAPGQPAPAMGFMLSLLCVALLLGRPRPR